MNSSEQTETYAVGQVARLTGVSPDLLRAWERRYQAVEPIRTEGGTRRYRRSDIARLRLLKNAVDSGLRIGEVAQLSSEELEARLASNERLLDRGPLEEVLSALDRLDGIAAEQLISAQMSMLGPVRFAREFALPLLHAIGEAWLDERICIASEHLGSALLRSLLGSALRPTSAHRGAPVVVFGTLPGERHEIGLLVAAITALGAGASPLYLGADLPAEELAHAAKTTKAAALALSAVVTEPADLTMALAHLRELVPGSIEIWVGGPLCGEIEQVAGVSAIDSLTWLEQRIALLKI
jgi:DNA-binding transcriptional MerR regulator